MGGTGVQPSVPGAEGPHWLSSGQPGVLAGAEWGRCPSQLTAAPACGMATVSSGGRRGDASWEPHTQLSEPRDVAPRPTLAPPTPDWVRSAGSQGVGALAHPLARPPARGTVCVSVSPTGHETCTHTERCRDKGGATSSPLACGGQTMTLRVPLPVTSAPAGSRNRQGPLNPERLPGAGRWSRGWRARPAVGGGRPLHAALRVPVASGESP